MDLLVVQLKAAIRRLLDTKGVRGRVLDKVNRYGEIVIGVILERPAPPPHVTHAALPAEDPNARPQRDHDIVVPGVAAAARDAGGSGSGSGSGGSSGGSSDGDGDEIAR